MKTFTKEILICMIEQGYQSDVADYYLGKTDIHIYDGKIIELNDALQKDGE